MNSKLSIFCLARFGVPGLLALAVATLLFGNMGASAQQAALSQAPDTRMQGGYVAHPIQVKPVTKQLGKSQSVRLKTRRGAGTNIVLFPCQSDTDPEPIGCYGPGQIEQAYGVEALVQHRITGQGSTIVIIDVFGSSTIQADLQAFDADWGLPTPTFTVLTPFGVSGADTSGTNILFSSGVAGYTVQNGWDAVTGWGSPRAADLLPLLIAHEHADDAQGL